MDAILLIFAIQLAVLLAFLAFSIDFSKLGFKLSARRIAQALKSASALSFSLCLRAFGSSEETLPESILETQAEDTKDRPVDSRVILLENEKKPTELAAEEEESAKEDDVDMLDCDASMKPNELFASEFGAFRFFSRAFCWIFSIRATLFSNKRNCVASAKLSTSVSKQISTLAVAKKRNYVANLNAATGSSQVSTLCSGSGVTYSLRYRNQQVPASVAIVFRKKLTKLNFVIFKKKRTRPMSVIYEIPEEVY